MVVFLVTLSAAPMTSRMITWKTQELCRQKCSRRERVYIYCTNNKLCCVKPKFQPREQLWPF
uniref:Beta-defensin n=1 Tax=Ursus maritimus TaxID=29073 RepID=A0A452SZF4_URSMA